MGRSFAMFKNYHIDGNKEMIAIGTTNIVGSFTSCYLTTGKLNIITKCKQEYVCNFSTSINVTVIQQMVTLSGPFSRSAVNYNTGCKTATSNIVMAIAFMLTLLFSTPLFYYTPLVVLTAIIVFAMLGLIDYQAVIHLWKIDKFDFVVYISAYC